MCLMTIYISSSPCREMCGMSALFSHRIFGWWREKIEMRYSEMRERERCLAARKEIFFFQLTNNISRSYLHFSSTDVPVIATDRERWGNTHRALARWWEKNVVCCLFAWGVYVVCLLHLLGLLRALFSLLSSTHDRAVIVISQKS